MVHGLRAGCVTGPFPGAVVVRQVVRARLRLLRGSPVSDQFEVRRPIMTITPDAAGPDGAGWEIPADDAADEEVDVLYLAGQRPSRYVMFRTRPAKP